MELRMEEAGGIQDLDDQIDKHLIAQNSFIS
jgi:hypothetical protein